MEMINTPKRESGEWDPNVARLSNYAQPECQHERTTAVRLKHLTKRENTMLRVLLACRDALEKMPSNCATIHDAHRCPRCVSIEPLMKIQELEDELAEKSIGYTKR